MELWYPFLNWKMISYTHELMLQKHLQQLPHCMHFNNIIEMHNFLSYARLILQTQRWEGMNV